MAQGSLPVRGSEFLECREARSSLVNPVFLIALSVSEVAVRVLLFCDLRNSSKAFPKGATEEKAEIVWPKV